MAKKSVKKAAKSLVIVESPAKARTIARFLGSDVIVEASIGHVRDLPEGAKEVPEEYKGETWAHLGVNVDDGFKPVYIVPKGKKPQVARLRKALKEAGELYLATDEDREGEAISWHLCELLKPKVPIHRLVFHEITRDAILEAWANPREIDSGMVRAQETRRILDRLYGYEVSPLLWRKIRPKLSAGRVQSVALRRIVERERERIAFHSASYWDLVATFAADDGQQFDAKLISVDGRQLPTGGDFDSSTGKIKNPQLLVMSEDESRRLAEKIDGESFCVTELIDKPYQTEPYAPFTTSTMQQEANRKLGFSARQTMQVAQSLYENGHITYMRTDSTNLATVAVEAARDLVRSQYGPDYLSPEPRVYASKVKNAQEAHEAIRPAGHPFALPDALKDKLSREEYRLFELIWKRTIASQMANARGHNITATIEGGGAKFKATGRTIEFAGYLRAYVEGSDDPEAQLADRERLLPTMHADETLRGESFEAKGHTTQPPGRYSEASLIKRLEGDGVGRPSTYAAIIHTILSRDYVFKKGNALVPTWVAFSVIRLLEEHLGRLVDYQFTAQMEDDLDAISRGEKEHTGYLSRFYFGNGDPGLKKELEDKIKQIDARDISRFSLGEPASGEFRDDIVVRVGRYGPFVEQGDRRASIPEKTPPDEMTMEVALNLLEKSQQSEEPLGIDPDTHKPVFLKEGRFGPYVQLGTGEDEEKPKNASLLKGMVTDEVTLEVALKLLSLPRDLGDHPEKSEPVTAYNGRYGPYVKCGEETRSLPADVSPLEVDLQQALALLAQPRTGGRQRGPAKEPIKVFEASPVTGDPVKLLDGRYGPYVTDGQTNISLPKGAVVEEVTFETALDMLALKAAKSPAPRKKKAAKKKTAKKTAKKAAKKKSTKKKSAKKEDAEK
jgi:DNA topoisomerase-1